MLYLYITHIYWFGLAVLKPTPSNVYRIVIISNDYAAYFVPIRVDAAFIRFPHALWLLLTWLKAASLPLFVAACT